MVMHSHSECIATQISAMNTFHINITRFLCDENHLYRITLASKIAFITRKHFQVAGYHEPQ